VNRPIPRSLFPGLLASTLLAGCSLHRLPDPKTPDCAPASSRALWQCIDGIPRQDRPESAFTSTFRVSDVSRKEKDQTVPSACEGPTPAGFALERLEMPPGRAPLVAFVAPPSGDSTPIVFVVHGMFDSKNTRYAQVTGELLRRQGFGVVIPDMRFHGCLLSKQWLPTLGIEEGTDLAAWAARIAGDYPGHPIGLVGFSMGALSVLHAMGEKEAAEVFRAGAVAVCPAADLPRAVRYLDAKVFFADSGFTASMRKGFRSYLRKRSKELGVDSDGTFQDVLRRVAAASPALGPEPEQLLRRADPSSAVAASPRPVLILVTSNDPIIPASSIGALERAGSDNPRVHVIETPYGGHIGQPGTSPDWYAAVVSAFFRYSAEIPD
jgi:predicted alpha/beta-fold hydrolase